MELLADTGSVLELRPRFGEGVVTALIRIEGRPMGLIANNPAHLGGAIDRDAADKTARFLQLCDAHGLPVVSLCDTPGFMVGPEAEQTATVRHFSRLFVTGANLTVPMVTRSCCARATASARRPCRWQLQGPAGHGRLAHRRFGAMGLEGAVRLGFRKRISPIPCGARKPSIEMVGLAYERGKALNAASVFELDDVIDPADTRSWITAALPMTVERGRRPNIDTW